MDVVCHNYCENNPFGRLMMGLNVLRCRADIIIRDKPAGSCSVCVLCTLETANVHLYPYVTPAKCTSLLCDGPAVLATLFIVVITVVIFIPMITIVTTRNTILSPALTIDAAVDAGSDVDNGGGKKRPADCPCTRIACLHGSFWLVKLVRRKRK